MYMNGSPEVRYRIINETISQDDNLLNISYLCEIAGVSRSGFYYWRGHQTERTASDEADQRDFDLIVAAYNFRGYSKGARGIHMRLRHQDPRCL
jgi:putative transposase